MSTETSRRIVRGRAKETRDHRWQVVLLAFGATAASPSPARAEELLPELTTCVSARVVVTRWQFAVPGDETSPRLCNDDNVREVATCHPDMGEICPSVCSSGAPCPIGESDSLGVVSARFQRYSETECGYDLRFFVYPNTTRKTVPYVLEGRGLLPAGTDCAVQTADAVWRSGRLLGLSEALAQAGNGATDHLVKGDRCGPDELELPHLPRAQTFVRGAELWIPDPTTSPGGTLPVAARVLRRGRGVGEEYPDVRLRLIAYPMWVPEGIDGAEPRWDFCGAGGDPRARVIVDTLIDPLLSGGERREYDLDLAIPLEATAGSWALFLSATACDREIVNDCQLPEGHAQGAPSPSALEVVTITIPPARAPASLSHTGLTLIGRRPERGFGERPGAR